MIQINPGHFDDEWVGIREEEEGNQFNINNRSAVRLIA